MAIRLFVASFDDIKDWGKDSDRLYKTLEDTDVIFFIQGNDKLTPAKERMIGKVKEMVEVHIADSDAQNQGIFTKKLLLKFLEKGTKGKYDLYIIGSSMKCIYDDKDGLEQWCDSILYNHKFQVKRLKPQKDDAEENLQILMDGIFENGTTENEKKKLSPKENTRPEKQKQVQDAKPAQSVKKSKAITSLESQRSTVEKDVFGSAIESVEYIEEYTELQDARANYIAQLQKRTERHIRQLLFQKKATVVLTNDEFYDFVALMMSSDNASVFLESWKSQHTLDVDMTDATFASIKPEITFFNIACELLYERDFWEE